MFIILNKYCLNQIGIKSSIAFLKCFSIFSMLNIPIHLDKTLGPDTIMIFLGITLDSNTMQASLPHENIRYFRNTLSIFG